MKRSLLTMMLVSFFVVGALAVDGRQNAQTFADVPSTHMFYSDIEKIYALGITAGCDLNPLRYCPDIPTPRFVAAVFIERGLGQFNPQPSAIFHFDDVDEKDVYRLYIEDFAARGLTSGCAIRLFCPYDATSRAQVAVFIVRALGETDPPSPPIATFVDVPTTHYAYRFIEAFARRGLTAGCAPGVFCPDDAVTRGQMAAFIVRAFNP